MKLAPSDEVAFGTQGAVLSDLAQFLERLIHILDFSE
mgnify:CR=1 FL=1